jgi:hypothetical protein
MSLLVLFFCFYKLDNEMKELDSSATDFSSLLFASLLVLLVGIYEARQLIL